MHLEEIGFDRVVCVGLFEMQSARVQPLLAGHEYHRLFVLELNLPFSILDEATVESPVEQRRRCARERLVNSECPNRGFSAEYDLDKFVALVGRSKWILNARFLVP
jgi:hypothetical protein